MGYHIGNVGDDGFTVYVPEGPKHFGDAIEAVEEVCKRHGVNCDLDQTECNNDDNTLRVLFLESQDEDTVEAIQNDLRQGKYRPATPPAPRTFMVTVNWRGSMHVSPLRTFTDEGVARAYAKTCEGGTTVMYETFPDREPKKLKL